MTRLQMTDPIVPHESEFTGAIRVVPGPRGAAWLRQGWEYFRFCPLPWVATVAVFLVAIIGLGFVPFVGWFSSILVPVFLGGIMLGCRLVARGVTLRLEHVLDAFREHTANLLWLGLLSIVISIVLTPLVVFGFAAIVGASALAAAISETLVLPAFAGAFTLGLFGLAIGVPLTMATWFAPALIAFHDVSPVDAVRLSFLGCARNWPAFVVYALVLIPLTLLAMLPLGLGLFVLIPVGWGSMYASYLDVFGRSLNVRWPSR
jgi:hypothetical protein